MAATSPMSTSELTGPSVEGHVEPRTNFLGIPIAVWGPLIAVIPALITAVVTSLVAFRQGVNSVPPPWRGVSTEADEADINKVKAAFLHPANPSVGHSIECSGTIDNFKPEKQHLWVAVEVNGYLWFKDSRVEFDPNHSTWKTTVYEGGVPKEISLILYITTDEANSEILRWLALGSRSADGYKPITSAGKGAFRADHLNFIQVQDRP